MPFGLLGFTRGWFYGETGYLAVPWFGWGCWPGWCVLVVASFFLRLAPGWAWWRWRAHGCEMDNFALPGGAPVTDTTLGAI
jgi:hypothetical protein